MPERYTYLMVDALCILFPFVFSFHPKIRFYTQWNYFVLPSICTALFFLVWDILFTKAGVWSFNPSYVVGIYLFGLPIEEYLFFLCIPYACVFTYYCLNLFIQFRKSSKPANIISFILIAYLTATALRYLPQLYTSITFLLLAILLLYLTLIRKVTYMAAFYISFLIILIPFFMSNGLLTGTGLSDPVVSYNNKYNLGVRMMTIPFEDTFYGMLLLLMNVSGFEYLKRRSIMES
jgi:lycopene cyclase domain-containing protein